MAYPSKRIAITAEAIASVAEIEAAGGKRTLTIRNHLIQDQTTAQAVANAYLAEYKEQKTKLRMTTTAPLPYEVGDTIRREYAEMPYLPAAEGKIPYAPAAEGKHYYKYSREMVIRKITISFRGGNYVNVLELED